MQIGNKTKLKIAIFHLGFFFSGGGERLVIEEARGLRKLGHHVDVYAPTIDAKNCFPDLIKDAQIKHLFLPMPRYFPLRDFVAICGALIFTPFMFWRFITYDIYFGANQPGPLICFLLNKILHKPYVIYLAQPTRLFYPRSIDQDTGFGKGTFNLLYFTAKLFRRPLVYLDAISIKTASAVLVNGSYMEKIISDKYKVNVINCPASAKTIKPLSRIDRGKGRVFINGKKYAKPYILVTNRHFPQKRFDYIISTMPFIVNQIPDVSLIITGASTTYTEFVKKMVYQLGLTNKIFFTNLLSERDLMRAYSNASVYVYTAPEEDFGMGVIEAMAYGVPAIAWDFAGPATTIKHQHTGLLVPKYKLAKFAEANIRLVKDIRLNKKMGKKAAAYIAKNYTYLKHNQLINETLRQAMNSLYARK